MMQPSIFVGHGNPMNALRESRYGAEWQRLGEQMPRPKAIISVSAHWFIAGTSVTNNEFPETIHDFGGFPNELYQVRYPAQGDLDLASRLQSLLAPLPVTLDETWGLDHGTWSVLRHVYRDADIPVIQLSIDARQPASFHLELGKRLAPLRSEGILIMGSGNLVHNLQLYAWGQPMAEPRDWAARFENRVTAMLSSGEFEPLVHYEELGPDARLSIPTPDHYLPLLYVLGTWQQDEPITFPVQGIEGSSVSMLTVRIG
jgi:4,5-DOPA dioxygenase extradiol